MNPSKSVWARWADEQLDRIDGAGQRRLTRPFDARGPRGVRDGRSVVSFASNDYLGLSAHPAVIEAACVATARWGTGATASRLVVGDRPCHEQLETALAAWKGEEAALVFPTGFMANLGVLATVGGRDTVLLSDELNHASLIDGCRLSRSEVAVYRHGNLDHLRSLLDHHRGQRLVVVTDAVFSMDGDVADLQGLCSLCADHGALLVLDEAHTVLGPDLPDETRQGAEILRVGTLSKAVGSLGGFVAGPRPLVDLLVNRARSFIFTTGLTPADTAAALAAVRIIDSAEGDDLLDRLRGHVDQLVPGHPSPIIPIIVGTEEAAVASSDTLAERGLLVPAIRPPTVPPGTSRLRATLSSGHTADEVATLRAALAELGLLGS